VLPERGPGDADIGPGDDDAIDVALEASAGGREPELPAVLMRGAEIEAGGAESDGGQGLEPMTGGEHAEQRAVDLLTRIRRRMGHLVDELPRTWFAGRFTAEIARLDLSRVRRVAATLVRNVERDIRSLLGPVSADEPPDEPTPTSLLGLPDGVDAEWATHLLGERLRDWIGVDAGIVLAIAVIGETSDEVATRLGMTPSAVRKRYRRALARLREQLEK